MTGERERGRKGENRRIRGTARTSEDDTSNAWVAGSPGLRFSRCTPYRVPDSVTIRFFLSMVSLLCHVPSCLYSILLPLSFILPPSLSHLVSPFHSLVTRIRSAHCGVADQRSLHHYIISSLPRPPRRTLSEPKSWSATLAIMQCRSPVLTGGLQPYPRVCLTN